jgi:uncharacterized membrane protein
MLDVLLADKLWRLGVIGLVAANAAYFLPAPFGWPITLLYFLFAPGYLSLQFIARKAWSRWETLSFALGLSLLFIMVAGLALNALGYAGLKHPLSPFGIFVALDIGTIILLALNRKLRISDHIRFGSFELKRRRLLGALLLLLPVGAAAGAMRLNNGASNEFTMAVFAVITVAFIVLMLRPSLRRYYPFALFLFALSILLSVSLRGWGITGHDIQREFSVFELTMQNGMWDIAAFRDPYNACLSITLLPTILAKITGIPDAYIFKVVFQFIAAFAVIPAYFFVRRLHGPRDALLAGFIFLLFPTFLNDMAMLNRQEIAFLFFGLIMLLMLLAMQYRRLQILTMLLLIGLTLSHYSSSYVMLGLMLAAWLVNLVLFRITKPRFVTENINVFPIMTFPIIILASLFVFTWNDQITQTTKGLTSTLAKTFEGLGFDKKTSAQASDVRYSIFGQKSQSPQQIVDDYAQKINGGKVKLIAVDQPSIPVTGLGNILGGTNVLKRIHGMIRDSIAKLLQVLIAVGCFVLWWRIRRRRHSKYDLYVLSLCGGSMLLLIAITVLPQLSVDYGVMRLFQQLLFILALPIIAALIRMATLVTKDTTRVYAFVSVFLGLVFLHTSGFIPQLTGGYTPQLSLNNSGFYYDAYYVTEDQKQAANWTCQSLPGPTPKAYDAYAKLRVDTDCANHMVSTSPMDNFMHAYVYNYGPNVRDGTYMVNINSNLYYYKPDRPNFVTDRLYDNGSTYVTHMDGRGQK